MLDTPSIAILVLSCLVSFGLGRLIVRWRKRRDAAKQPPPLSIKHRAELDSTPSLNKSKRRRQQRQHRGHPHS